MKFTIFQLVVFFVVTVIHVGLFVGLVYGAIYFAPAIVKTAEMIRDWGLQ